MAVGVRLHKLPSEVLEMSVKDFELLMAHFVLESAEADRATARQRAQQNISQLRR